MSSNAAENVQTKTVSLGGDWKEKYRQMVGSVDRQKWEPCVAEDGLWVIQMHTADAEMLQYRARSGQTLKRYKIRVMTTKQELFLF